MIKGKDFIITALQPWDINIGSNVKDIAAEIAKNNRVLYINTPRKLKEGTPMLQQISKNLWTLNFPFSVFPVNFLPDGCLFDFVNKMNQKKMYSYVLKQIHKLGFKDYILFMDNDIYRSFYAKELLQPKVSVYYRRDNLSTPYWAKHAPRLEPLLCGKSDCVVANSSQLAEAVRPYNKNAFDVGQGVDLTAYSEALNYAIPADIQPIKKPIVGYIGWITTRRLDADLIYSIAKKRPEVSYVLVGSEDDDFKNHPLHQLKNVHFLGNKDPEDVPSYINAFDICINPQIINKITIGNYPRKIDEYLAFGKPTIATHTNMMNYFKDYVWLCKTDEDYLQAIDSAIEDTDATIKEKRIAFANEHTWENSVNKIYSHIKL